MTEHKVWPHDSAHRENDASFSASVGAPSQFPFRDAHSLASSTSVNTGIGVSGGAPVAGVSADAAWDFTRRLSPRSYVRSRSWDTVSERFAYKARHVLTAGAPVSAWAIHLANESQLFTLLAFDFDAKAPTPALQSQFAARADADVQRLVQLLAARGIEYTVCASGPGGGRHVWVAPVEPVPLATVRHLAKAVQTICPSLDIRPLSNAKRGLVRPPGAPHYNGGASRWIAGAPPSALLSPSVTDAQMDALIADVDDLAAAHHAAAASAGSDRRTGADLDPCELRPGGPLTVAADRDGAPHVAGVRRSLPRRILERARTPLAPHEDGSAEQFRILCAAANARWTLSEVATELAPLPGMEHARSVRVDGGRVPRSPAAQEATLREDWARAVARVARRQTPTGPLVADSTFDEDAGALVDAIEHLRRRADLSRGRWSTRTGAVDRLVLSTLMLIAAETVKTVIAADIRTVAVRTVCIGRESAREALHRLADDGWIQLHTESVGPSAAEWELLPYGTNAPEPEVRRAEPTAATEPASVTNEKNDPDVSIHSRSDNFRSHQLTRGGGGQPPTQAPSATPGTDRREQLLRELRSVQDLTGHDCFTADHRAGLGARAAVIYSLLPDSPVAVDEFDAAGFDRTTIEETLVRLVDAGLVEVTATGIYRGDPSARDTYALYAGTDGIAAARAEQYAIESAVWAWWCSEEHVVAAHASAGPRRGSTDTGRTGILGGQLTFELDTAPHWADLPPYPRGRLGRPNHRAAHRYIERRREQQRLDELHATA